MIGLVLAILGLVFTMGESLVTTIGSCGIGATYCPNQTSLEVNSGTYAGVIVMICGMAFVLADLIRGRTRTSYLRDFPKA